MDTNGNLGTEPPPGYGGTPRLTRRLDRKVVAGVCAGLGDAFDLDPVIFRVAFVLLALFGGVGIIAYGLAWWIMPGAAPGTAGWTEPRSERVMRRAKGYPLWLGVALVAIGAALLLGRFHWWSPGLVWGVTLIALGVLLFRQGTAREDGARSTTAVVQGVPTAPSSAERDALPDVPRGPAPRPAGPPAPRSRRRERSALGWITLGAALLAVGTAALLDSAGVLVVSLGQYLALALAVIGLGLLVGSVYGRARWLMVLGVVLVPFVLVASLVDVPLRGGLGQRLDHPTAVAQVQGSYHLVAGQEVIDLRDVPASGRLLRITATVGAGQLAVVVPRGAEVRVHGRVGGGQVFLLGQRFDGVRMDVTRSFAGRATGAAGERIVLDLRVGIGEVRLTTSDAGLS